MEFCAELSLVVLAKARTHYPGQRYSEPQIFAKGLPGVMGPGSALRLSRTTTELIGPRRAPLLRRLRWHIGRLVLERADLAQGRVRGALAALPGAVDGAPERLVRGFAGEEHVADRLGQDFSRELTARRGRRHRTHHERRGVPARRAGFLHGGGDLSPEQLRDPFPGEGRQGLFALLGEIAAERAADIDRTQRGTA